MLKFALAALFGLAVLAVITALILRSESESEAIDQAKAITAVLARGAVEPAVETGLVEGDPQARARIDRIVRGRVLSEEVVRVKIWSPDGRIVYSDEPRLIGARYELGADELEALETGAVDAELSDLSGPENRFDRGFGELLEVYLPIQVPGEGPLLFETYQRYSSVSASGSDLLARFAPVLIGALAAIALLQVPLAWSLARRLRREHIEREALLRRALDAQDLERRRIAADLHDGILQDLTAASYSLGALQENPPGGASGERLARAATASRAAVRQLRSLLVEIYPPRLREAGLESAIADLLEPLTERGIEVEVELPPGLELPPELEALAFRVSQEALRNVAAHSGASRVELYAFANGAFELSVRDNGRGFAPEQELERRREGHMGLRLLRDLAADAGATLSVDSAPGEGTTVTLRGPAR